MKGLFGLVAGLVVVGFSYFLLVQSSDGGVDNSAASEAATSSGGMVDVLLPAGFSPEALLGKRAFDAKCASCHNTDGAGRAGTAPPLIHKIYEPSHHNDESFQRAAANGVRSHHWSFGDMPPVDGLTRGDVQMIVNYIREIQRENGIY